MVSATTVVFLICTLLSLSDPVPKISAEPREWSLPLDLTKHVKDSELLPLNLTKHVTSSVVDQLDSATKLLQQFERFMMDFGKSYASLAEKMMRFEIFKENLKIIEDLMASKRGSARFGVGPFADMSAAEFRSKYFRWGGLGPRPREHSVQRRTPGRVSAVNKKDPSDRGRRKKIVLQNIDPFKTDPIPMKFSNPADKPTSTGSKPASPAIVPPSTDPKLAVSPAVASSSTDPKPASSAVVPPSTGQKPVAPVFLQNRITGQVVPVIRHPVTGKLVIAVPHPLSGPRPHPGAARPVFGVKPLTIKAPERCLSRTGSCKIYSPGLNYDKNAPPGGETPKVTPKTKNVPRDLHWIENEFYPPPENQNVINQECGTCWAYASAAVMEILVSKKLRQIVRFSKQQLIDCVIENFGCDGGDLQFALTYIMNEGLALERDYPFTGKDGKCLNVTDKYIVQIRELQLMNTTHLIRSGIKNFSPLATYFYAPTGLEHYTGGVLDPPPEECQDIERLHAVVIVGYNGDELLMRNSWGPDWGENGNFWIKTGVCGLGNETYAISEWLNLPV